VDRDVFWKVGQQLDASSGWEIAGGVEGSRRLHISLEGPNPDPRRPEPRDMPDESGRFPLYSLVVHLPNGDELGKQHGGASWSKGRDGVYPPSIMHAEFALPPSEVAEITAVLYDDSEIIGTARLMRLTN
jgi:hypothetical protein